MTTTEPNNKHYSAAEMIEEKGLAIARSVAATHPTPPLRGREHRIEDIGELSVESGKW